MMMMSSRLVLCSPFSLLVYNFHLPDALTYLLEALLGVMGCKS